MTKEEAKQIIATWLVSSKGAKGQRGYIEGWFDEEDVEAFRMAIEALSIEAMPIEEVWECVQPLKDKILDLEEKLMDAEAIVRCKNCISGISDYPLHLFPNRTKAQARQYSCEHSTYSHDADFFCAYGEERKDYREFNF